jgi:hypothetical protein
MTVLENGNVVQIAKLGREKRLTIALAFGSTPADALASARQSLKKGFKISREQYERGWNTYLSSLHQVRTTHVAQTEHVCDGSESSRR